MYANATGVNLLYANTNVTLRSNSTGTTNDWVFDADGNLTIPHGGKLGFDLLAKHEYGAIALQSLGGVGTYAAIASPYSFVQVRDNEVEIQSRIDGETIYNWTFGANGVLTLSTASTILGNSSDPNVYIETSTTSTTSTWTFGADGNLTLPVGGTIRGGGTGTDVTIVASTGTNAKTWTFGADGTSHFPDKIILAPSGQDITLQSSAYTQIMWAHVTDQSIADMYDNTNSDFYVESGGATLDIGYKDGSNNQQYTSWHWSKDGSFQFPDTTAQTTAWRGLANAGDQTLGGKLYLNGKKLSDGPYEANSIEMGASLGLSAVRGIGGPTGGIVLQTGAGYTVEHAWQFGYDGKLTLPDGGTLRMSTAPISSTGTVGDIAGTIAVNTASIFYCIADFVLDTGTYSVLTTDNNDGSVFFMEVAKGTYPQPQMSWGISINGDITYIDGAVTDLGTSWRMSVNSTVAYSSGTTLILTNPSPSQPDIWVKQAWGTTGSW
jgi:hypothetical protein